MAGRQTVDYDPVEALLEQGRRDLAAGDPDKARWCFEEVLRRRPDDPRAKLGLRYVTRKSERPGSEAILAADVRVVELVRDKRYEEALELLERERLVRPNDEALERSIQHLRAHLQRPSAAPRGGRKQSGSHVKVREETVAYEAVDPRAAEEYEASLRDTGVRARAAIEEDDDEDDEDYTLPYIEQSGSISYFPPRRKSDAPPEATSDLAAEGEPARDDSPAADEASTARESVETPARESLDDAVLLIPKDMSSSGGIKLADDEPSGPALGSLPPPSPDAAPERSGATYLWIALALSAAGAVAYAVLG